jgi:hypothetical protein
MAASKAGPSPCHTLLLDVSLEDRRFVFLLAESESGWLIVKSEILAFVYVCEPPLKFTLIPFMFPHHLRLAVMHKPQDL